MPRDRALKRWYDLTLETLTPLHIALGPDALLIPDEECALEGERTLVLDRLELTADLQVHPPSPPPPPKQETYRDVLRNPNHPNYHRVREEFRISSKLGFITLDSPIEPDAEATPAQPAPDWQVLARTRPRDLPGHEQRWRRPEGRHLVRYELLGTPELPDNNRWWQSISRLPRTPDGRILVPGSSLKGALRSLLAWAAAVHLGPGGLPPPDSPDERAKYAARSMEARTLAAPAAPWGRQPNYDAGRLLQVHDAALDGAVLARITPFGVCGRRAWRTFAGGGTPQGPGALETVPRGATFTARLAVDRSLLEDWHDTFAHLRPVLPEDLSPVLAAGRAYATAMLEADANFLSMVGAARQVDVRRPSGVVAAFQARLATLPANATLIRLGWGTGRLGKAPFRLLRPDLKPKLPASRRLAVGDDGQPGEPFGWLLCTVTPRAGA